MHVERDSGVAKYWLEPVRLQSSGGFRGAELRTIERIVAENTERFLKEWHGFFGNEN